MSNSLLIWFIAASRTAAVINDWIRKLKFFEDTVALGTYQGNIFMVDMNTREIKSRLDGHTDEISAIDWDGESRFRFLSCRQKHPFPALARFRARLASPMRTLEHIVHPSN
jgi:WD40 repeat protein